MNIKISRILLVASIIAVGMSVASGETPGNKKIKYDLAEYIFHENLRVQDGSMEFTITYHGVDTEKRRIT